MTQNELRSNDLPHGGDLTDHELCVAFLSDELPETQLRRFEERLQADENLNGLLAETADIFCILDGASSLDLGTQLQHAGLACDESASLIQPVDSRDRVRRLASRQIVVLFTVAATIGGLIVGFALQPTEDEQAMVAKFWADQTIAPWQGSAVEPQSESGQDLYDASIVVTSMQAMVASDGLGVDGVEPFGSVDDLDSDWLSTEWMLVAMQDSVIADTQTGDRDAG